MKCSATRDCCLPASASSSCYHSFSLGTPWNGIGTVEQKERRQMAKTSPHILPNPSLSVV